MSRVVDKILAYHRGRNPQLLARKWARMRENPFAFFRGTAVLYYEAWNRQKLPAAPLVWNCGDAHLENVGSYKGDNRVPYFDLNDFDEACLAPAHWEVGRALTALHLLGEPVRARRFLAAYRLRLMSGKPQHIEPEVARGVIAELLEHVQDRKKKAFLASRLKHGKILIRPDRTYAIDAATKRRAVKVFRSWASRQAEPARYHVEDICGRVAGNGSLGVERFVVLVRDKTGKKAGKKRRSLMDMKQAVPCAGLRWLKWPQPAWKNHAERVATVQRIMQYVPMAHLGWVAASVPYVVRELQPIEDRVNLVMLDTEGYDDFIDRWADLVASAHLRSGGWQGSAPLQALMDYGAALRGPNARRLLAAARRVASEQKRQYAEFLAGAP